MSRLAEIVRTTKTSNQDWTQEAEEAIDASGFTEGAFVVTVHCGAITGDDAVVILQTAVDQSSEEFFDVGKLATIPEGTTITTPLQYYTYFAGAGVGVQGSTAVATDYPGFARFLRVRISGSGVAGLVFSVKALLKP